MNQPLHTGRLALTPQDPYYLPADLAPIIEKLSDIEFIHPEISDDNTTGYRLGDRFLQLVTFMGCSPAIQFEPDEAGNPYCHMTVAGPYESPRLLYGRNTTPPRCASCRKRIENWRTFIGHSGNSAPDGLTACPNCGHRQNPTSYNWRQSAGSGRLFLFIENIFPQEAIPATELLTQLSQVSENKPWHYFYLQEESPAKSGIDSAAIKRYKVGG
ncbi:MAG: hypothetical protein KZQ93_07630 [Candidatus Thiodiazotropha sp. (ex Monitilora ramsayi)]|nr:hypothetical protein [Candidatus Thiodiazotropha sp. (ex Monitilora ramsayi)]